MKRSISAETKLLWAIDDAKILSAKLLINHMQTQPLYPRIQDAEFKVFSQWGDDGIIQYLIHHLKIMPQTFIEFGIEHYDESNTRFLLMNNNWEGLVIDPDSDNIEYLRGGEYFWRYQLTAVCDFVTRENINELFVSHGFQGPLGILSIDIDGNDYWIWQAIDVVDPVVVIIEYNSVFGISHAITVPYTTSFDRTRAHYSNLYFGASLKALCRLAQQKGYSLVGTNSAGNNAYFVRNEALGPLQALSPETGYVRSKFRESQYQQGGNSYLGGADRLRAIADLVVVDVEQEQELPLRELL